MRLVVALFALFVACSPASPPAPPEAPPPPVPPPTMPTKAKPAAQEKVSVQLYFLDEAKYAAGASDAIVAVERKIGANNPPRNAVWFLFKGPNPKEKERGLTFVPSGATGFKSVRVKDGIAHVTLKDGCASGGATLTIYDLLVPTLKQFEEVQYVKVYDPSGQTADPTGPSDSRPACLEP